MKEVFKRNKPSKFTPGEGNVLVAHVAEHQKLCALIEKNYHIRADELSLYEFFSRLNDIRDDLKKQAEHAKAGVKQE